MRIGTNFSFPYDRALPALVSLGWGSAILGLGLAVLLVTSGAALRAENPDLRKKLEDYQKDPVIAVPKTGQPSARDLVELRDHLADLNRLGAGGGPSTTGLLARLEQMTPPGVRLLSFQNDRDTQEIQLVAEALTLDNLSRFLETLEKSDAFSRVNLTKQGQAPEGSANWIQFSVDLSGSPP